MTALSFIPSLTHASVCGDSVFREHGCQACTSSLLISTSPRWSRGNTWYTGTVTSRRLATEASPRWHVSWAEMPERSYSCKDLGQNIIGRGSILVRVLQKNRAGCVYLHRETYFKELAHVIVEAGSLTSVGQPSRSMTQRRADVAAQVWRHLEVECLPF